MEDEEEFVESYRAFDFAIMAVFTRLVFDISTQFGRQKQKLKISAFWSHERSRLESGVTVMRNSAIQAMVISMTIVVAVAVGLSLPTRQLEERMVLLLEGLMYLFSGFVLGLLSFEVAVWTGVYHEIWEEPKQETARTLKQLRFNVHYNIYGIFGRYLPVLMPFFQGVKAVTIPVSILAGIGAGLVIDGGVYLARRRTGWIRWIGMYLFMVCAVFASSFFLGEAVWYIVNVWGQAVYKDSSHRDVWFSVPFLTTLLFLTGMHILRWWITHGSTQKSLNIEPILQPNRPRTVASLFFSARALFSPSNRQVATNSTDQTQESVGMATVMDDVVSESMIDKAKGGEEDGINEAASEQDDDNECSSSPKPQIKCDNDGDGSIDEWTSEIVKAEDDESLSYREMFYRQKWCGCVRRNDQSQTERAWNFLKWAIWFLLVIGSLWLVVVNIGSTEQQEAARKKFPEVQRILYNAINDGPVCAFDNRGANSNITSFPSKEEAHASGFLVVHCGECGACSDWHNLRLEYTTRTFLAEESKQCAKKSLFGGRQAVLECLQSPTIGFQGKCSECWVDDILCTKKFCSMIFLQSTLINSVTDLRVNEETITSAACEEAHCEAGNPGDFVLCSGATRRRMNVHSDIERPGSQRCSIVDVDWAEVFPE